MGWCDDWQNVCRSCCSSTRTTVSFALGGALGYFTAPLCRYRQSVEARALRVRRCLGGSILCRLRARVQLIGHARIRYVGNFSHAWFEMAD